MYWFIVLLLALLLYHTWKKEGYAIRRRIDDIIFFKGPRDPTDKGTKGFKGPRFLPGRGNLHYLLVCQSADWLLLIVRVLE